MSVRRYVVFAGTIPVVVGGALLALWLTGVPELVRFASWRGKLNTCIGLVCAGAGVIALSSQRARTRRIGVALAGVATAIGALTLVEYLAGISLGIDELVAADWPFAESAAHPNRMSPNAALSFVMFGAGLVPVVFRDRLTRIGQAIALALLAFDGVALIGYLYGATFLYRAGAFLRISPYTALCFCLLATAAIALQPERGVLARLSGPGIGAYLARRLLPAVVVIPIVLDWIRLEGERLGWWGEEFGLAFDALAYTAVFVALVLYLARSLDVIDAQRRTSELELRRTAELTAALARARTVDEVAKVTVDLGIPALDASAGAVVMLDADATHLRLVASNGYADDVLRAYAPLPVDTPTPIADAIRDRAMVFVASREELRRRYPALASAHDDARAFVAVPLVTSERALGAMVLSFGGGLPDSAARARIDRLVGQCSQALDRAALFDSERAARDVARAANRTKDDFLAMLGHELRNPLAPIAHALELMRIRNPAPQRERDVIERQVRHMTRLVDDLLDVSRIARGKIELARSRVELADAFDEAVELVRPLIDERKHALAVRVEPGIAIDGDRARIVQVVSNLLNNAAKYTRPGGRIEVVAEQRGDAAVIRCTDTGIGISAKLLPRIFDPFVQDEATIERATGGLGLGLAIVHSLVAIHGGTVTVASEGEDKGATFTITLPALAPAEAAVPAAPDELAKPAAPLRVLIVDDNQDAAEMMAEAIALAGHTVELAHDGARGLDIAAAFDPDCVMLDIGLPTIDGYEVARRLRERDGERHRTLVAITGYGQAEDVRRALDAGFDRHLVKPVSIAVTLEIIASAGR